MIKLYRILRRLFDGTGISRVWPLNVLHKWFLNQYNSDMVMVNGLKVYLDKVDTLKLTVKGEYDRYPLQIIEKILKPGDVVLDIGGNIGYYSLMMSKITGNHGKIFSFEPDEVSFSIFSKNVLENNLKNIEIYKFAATQENEKLKLFINKDNKGDNRIYESQSLNQDFIEIEGRRIDDILSDDIKVNFVKIDIQGSEFGAIKGMSKILENNPEITIYSEYWPEGMINFGSDPVEYLDYFYERGFYIFEVDCNRYKVFNLSREELLLKYPGNKSNQTDIMITKLPYHFFSKFK